MHNLHQGKFNVEKGYALCNHENGDVIRKIVCSNKCVGLPIETKCLILE